MKKSTKRNYCFSIIILSVLLAVSVAYNIMDGFNFSNKTKFNGVIGESIIINLNDVGSQSKSLAISGACLPNDIIQQKVQIVLPNIDVSNMILRAKVTLNDYQIKISGFDSWVTDESGIYYYYNAEKYKNQTVGLCSEIKLSENLSLDKNTFYYVNFTIELFYADGLNL